MLFRSLRDLLDVFIDKFVLCASCKNPETELIITKDDFILRDCKACGQRGNIDMRHKLTTFILKNPPKSKKAGGKGKKATAGADALLAPEEESDDELTKKIEAGANATLSPEAAAALIESNRDDDDWAIDTSKEAVAARIQELDSKLQNSLILEDDDDEGGGPYEAFGEWVRENQGVSDAEVYRKAEEMGIAKKHKTLVVLVQALFSEAIATEVAAHAGLLKKVRRFPPSRCRAELTPCAQLTTSEKHQKSLLGGVERLIGETHPQLIKADVPKILMAFYQAEIIEEEIVTHWASVASKKVRFAVYGVGQGADGLGGV